MTEAEPSPASDSPLPRLLSSVVAPVTVTTALLYYFGWLRSQTIAVELGYRASLLGMSPQDLILRSVQPVAGLAVVGGLLAWPAVVAHRWLAGRRRRGELGWAGSRRFADILVGFGLTATAGALVWVWVGFGSAGYPLPVLFGVAAVTIGYGTWLPVAPGTQRPTEVTWAVSVLALAGLFILTTVYARNVGLDQAELNIERASTSAVVTITSREPLHLPDLDQRRVDGAYQVTGLSLLFTSGGYHFVMPRDYDRQSNARVHTVPVEGTRLDFDASWAVPCVGFDDLRPGEVFEPGDWVHSAGVRYEVVRLGDPVGAGETPTATVEPDGTGGQSLRLNGVALSVEFSASFRAWLLSFVQRSPGVTVEASGRRFVGDTLVTPALHDRLAPFAELVVDGGSSGRVRFREGDRSLTSMVIGGSDLTIDCPIDP